MNNVEAFMKEGILIDPELNDDLKNIKVSLIEVVKALGIKFLSRKDFAENFYKIKLILENAKDRKGPIEREEIEKALAHLTNVAGSDAKLKPDRKEVVLSKENPKKNIENDHIRILRCYDLPPREINVGDFVEYFKSRYTAIKSILHEHSELSNLTLINKLSTSSKNVSIIGMVYSKRTTKNKNVILEVEDLTGKVKVIVNASKPELMEKCNQVVFDEVIGIKCSGGSDVLFANDIVFPDINSLNFKKRTAENEESAVFISDVHIGSKLFLEKNFLKFIDWINGKSGSAEQVAEALKVKYLFVVGDCVDGVGVYPGQEDKLAIKELSAQYDMMAKLLSLIRKDISIIVCPGQHDGSRVHEPQPPIAQNFAGALYSMENIFMVSNPALVEIARTPNKEGVQVLMYHGDSFHPMINEIEELRFGEARKYPTKVIKHWLKKRHLGPMHTTTTHIPIPEGDPLVIREIPDIVATGDMHRTDVSNYKGVLTINSSCWQSRTDFEEKVGNIPDPSKCPLVNLKTWEVKILDFNE